MILATQVQGAVRIRLYKYGTKKEVKLWSEFQGNHFTVGKLWFTIPRKGLNLSQSEGN